MRRRTTIRRATRLTALALAGLACVAAPAAAQDVGNGEIVYEKRCTQCHGPGGDGKGEGWLFMLPRPRVFADTNSYKFRTTPSGALPTDQDLFDIISKGIPGTSMPGFAVLPEQERWDVVAYIKALSEDFEDEDALAEAEPMPELIGATPPPATEESVAAGQALYEANACGKCHGDLGRGNGPSWNDLKDDWQNPILPANLANPETYRGGSDTFDIFRTISTGLNGTPMPAYSDSITPEERWSLVHYIETFHPPKQENRAEIVIAAQVDAVPETADDPAWDAAPPARFKTIPNIIEPPRLFWPTIEYVTVQALYSPEEIALRVQWDDRSKSTGTNLDASTYEDRDTTIYTGTDHPDQFAVQFAAKNDPTVRPYFFMGDGKRAVNLWWWDSASGALSERNAKGPGSVAAQTERSQTLRGGVTYDDGRYTLVVRRALKTEAPKRDVQLTPGEFTPILFHAWDGGRGEVGRRGAMTTWYWLYLRPEVPESVYAYPPFAFFLTLAFLLILGAAVRRKTGVSLSH